ncbi:MAG: hypothetical protein HYZ33_03905 [Ignavibacteriales bacterium]|nr:hypothetical protein [Ignavibacteriales bacterium]
MNALNRIKTVGATFMVAFPNQIRRREVCGYNVFLYWQPIGYFPTAWTQSGARSQHFQHDNRIATNIIIA